ncbi:MAG: NAD-binding protein [Actinobacteria bacterium]|nr:NAD-binding protein [Actinomycetota bacterium]
MNILIVGGGKSGSYVAEKLKENNKVTIIESRKEQVEILKEQLVGINIIKGDGCEPFILEKAGISQMDIVAALTGDDEDNLVISFLAKFQNNIPLVFARINNPKNEWLFKSNWGVDVAISASVVITNLMQERIGFKELITLLRLQKENFAVLEVILPVDAKSVGKTISEINFPENSRVTAIISGMKVVIPSGNTVLKEGDKLIIFSEDTKREDLLKVLGL